ncbi:hypothetical protein [uncultured Vagococcus sp.]|uniref:hypothetical protein n=1 Tax=uncultured Vagococcus sp. TaxID=189676 RepID=UPI0028D0DFAA|nr:hypothetical protein [uncultured Vagococcus sp.]
MRDYFQITEVLIDDLSITEQFSKEVSEELQSFGKRCRREIAENVSKGGSKDDYHSAAYFQTFMCMVDLYLHRTTGSKYLRMIQKDNDYVWEYGRKFREKLIGG